MLVLVDLFEFEDIAAPKLGVASSRGVGGFRQIVPKIAIAGFNHSGMFCFKVTGLISVLDKSSVFGNKGLRIETANIPNFSE